MRPNKNKNFNFTDLKYLISLVITSFNLHPEVWIVGPYYGGGNRGPKEGWKRSQEVEPGFEPSLTQEGKETSVFPCRVRVVGGQEGGQQGRAWPLTVIITWAPLSLKSLPRGVGRRPGEGSAQGSLPLPQPGELSAKGQRPPEMSFPGRRPQALASLCFCVLVLACAVGEEEPGVGCGDPTAAGV